MTSSQKPILNPYGNSIVYISFILIAILFIDILITKIPVYNYRTQSSSYALFFFAFEVLIFSLFQYYYLNLVRKMFHENQSYKSRRSYLQYIDRAITLVQILLIIILICITGEMIFRGSYHTILLSVVVWISCVTAVFALGTLIFRFVQWFRISHDRLILSYAFALGMILINCSIILAYINTSIETRPSIILSTRASVNDAHVVQIPLNNAYAVSSLISFISMWAVSIFSLAGYSKSIGKLKFWIVVALPLMYFLSQSQFIFGPFILAHRFIDPITFFRIYTITFASTKLVGGIMFAIPYILVSRKLNDPKIRI